MKKTLIIIVSILFGSLGFSQNLIEAEYFWDTDPGEGSGTALLALDGNFNSALETVFANNASLPAIGDHVFSVRVKGDDGAWSPVYKRVFRVGANNNSNLTAKVTQAEYFWDTDPGEGSGTTLLALDGNFNSALESVFENNATLPAIGDHIFGVRVKGDDGDWSPVYKRVFRISGNNNSNLTAKILQAEYFWDTDPGEGSGITLLALGGNFNSALETVFQNNATLPAIGDHILGVRVKGDDGNWSPVYKRVFRISGNNNSNLTANLVQAEYFWDTDPGEGSGTAMLAFDGNFNQAYEEVSANYTVALSKGLHVFNARVKAADGHWGPVYKKVVGVDISFGETFLISPSNMAVNRPLTDTLKWFAVTGGSNYEYQYSTDTTFGVITDSGIVNDTLKEILNLQYNTRYFWRVRVINGSQVGLWSQVWKFNTIGCPAINNTINSVICQGDSVLFDNTYLKANGTYKDTVQTTQGCDSIITLNLVVNPATSSLIFDSVCMGSNYNFNGKILTTTGTYFDTIQNANGCDSVIELRLANYANPVVSITPSANVLTATSGFVSYKWFKDGALINGQTTNMLTVSLTGNYRVEVSNTKGCTDTISYFYTASACVTVYDTVSNSICENDSVLFNTKYYKATGFYNDTLPNSIGCDSIVTLSLTINAKPIVNGVSNVDTIGVGGTVNFFQNNSNAQSYFWDFKDGVLSTLDSVSHTYNATGTYHVTVVGTSSFGCETTDTVTVVVVNTTSVNEIDLSALIKAYPNPASSSMTIDFGFDTDAVNSLMIFDSKGMLVDNILSTNINRKTLIDLSNYENGIYFIKLNGKRLNQTIRFSKVN